MGFVPFVLNWEFNMGFPSFSLAFFLVSHLLVLPSSGSCTSTIDCGYGLIKFPFTNTTLPQCGLCTIRCDEAVAQVIMGAEGRAYQISMLTKDAIKINDTVLRNLIKSNDCDFSSYINPPKALSISYTISPNLTFFKCDTSSPELENRTDDYFFGNYTYYRGCQGYTVYYSNQQVEVPTPVSIPGNCVIFELPVVSSVEDRNRSDPFSLLASEFSVEYRVSEECLMCADVGGQCTRDAREFQCVNERGGGGDGISGRNRLVLILATAVPAIGIMVILLVCIVFRNVVMKTARSESIFFWKTNTENYRNIEAFLKNCGSLSQKRYTYSDINKMTNSFKTKVGQGGFGCVFKGKLENGCFVAVKVLKGLKGEGGEFINEVATISRTSHVNIVTLLGFCFEGRHRALIYEFMPNGSLDKFIHDGGSLTYRQLSWEALYRIVVGIARGLEYLHRGCNTRILHFDIKPHNILLNEDFSPKISDFGLAKLCPQKESIISFTGARGTAGYIALEVFSRHFGGVSHKSDVYSYGMMVLEMVGGRKNIGAEVDRTSEIYFPHWVYKRLELDEELGLHGIMDDEGKACARKMIIVGLWCIQTDPSHRPSMSRVVEMLEGSLESLQIPPKPFLSSPSRSPVENSSTTLIS